MPAAFLARCPMLSANGQGYRPGMVDLTTGQISREIFVNEAIYQEELERVLPRLALRRP